MSRWARKGQILSVLYYWRSHDGLTMRQIAFWLQICPSSHLMNLLRELQAAGKLVAIEAPHRPNIGKFLWRLSSDGKALAKYHINNDWTTR